MSLLHGQRGSVIDDAVDVEKTGIVAFSLFYAAIVFSLLFIAVILVPFLFVILKRLASSADDESVRCLVSWFRSFRKIISLFNLDGPIGYALLILSVLPNGVTA